MAGFAGRGKGEGIMGFSKKRGARKVDGFRIEIAARA